MRLRLTIRRHSLPETSIIWVVETTPSPTIAELLEAVNESVPIESADWGYEDYAVEVKGTGGIDYECLHYQHVGKVFKEDDEVIIRPLHSQEIKTRKISGRHQVSAEGFKLYDGLAYGKNLTKFLANRPEVDIPPRKKRRITYHEDEDDDDGQESLAALEEEQPVSESGNSNKQLVLHADFDDEDEDDDEDFAPGADDPEADIDSDIDEEMDSSADDDEEEQQEEEQQEEEQQEPSDVPLDDVEPLSAKDKKALLKVPDEATRVQILNLHSAFPTSRIAICKHMLASTEGDMGKAFDAMTIAFEAVKSKSAITATCQKPEKSASETRAKSKKASKVELESEDEEEAEVESLPIPKIRSKRRKSPRASLEAENFSSQDVQPVSKVSSKRKRVSQPEPEPEIEPETELELEDFEEEEDLGEEDDDDEVEEIDPMIKAYDHKGFPPGFIKIGKVTTFEPEQANEPSSRPVSSKSNSVAGNKSVSSALNEPLSKGLTSTPFIDQEEQDEDEDSDDSSDDSSENPVQAENETSSSEGSDSSDSDSSDSDTSQILRTTVATILVSESDSDSSSDSSSDDDTPEEISSKPSNPEASNIKPGISPAAEIIKPTVKQKKSAPGQGSSSTQSRNTRRKQGSIMARYQEKGILPADTTVKEFQKLSNVSLNSSPAEGLAALDLLRSSIPAPTVKEQELTGRALAKTEEFNRRREELLASLAAGGIEIGQLSSNPVDAMFEAVAESFSKTSDVEDSVMAESQPDIVQDSIVSEEVTMSSADLTKAPTASESPSMAQEISSNDTPAPSEQPKPTSAESSRLASARRSKLDVGASARLLFGSLGFRAPKSKKDEEKIRDTLMKDVRPLKAPKVVEPPAVNPNAEAVDENPNSWRDTINYRAVECIQEGIELSEPPFPFIQRWDPQQQNPWKKRKKEQAEQSNYVDDNRVSKKQKQRKGKQNYQEEQEYLDESYQPTYQDESFVSNHDDPSQTGGLASENLEDEISQQLMNEIQPSIGEASQDPDDLTPLPADPNSLPNLEEGKSQVGMIVAFKTLECSPETRWQPQLSGYRTAIVIAIQDNGELTLTLAKRDRKKNNYDETTGERVYTKFEMVDLEDADEDEGVVYIMFEEMVEAKIVQEAPADLSSDNEVDMDEITDGQNIPSLTNSVTFSNERLQDEAQEESQPGFEEQPQQEGEESQPEAQFSHVTETPPQSDVLEQEDIVENSQNSDAPVDEEEEESIHSDASSPENIEDEVVRSPHDSDDQDPDQSRDVGDDTHAPSDADDDQFEDTEGLHEAQSEEDVADTSALSDGGHQDTEIFHDAQQQEDITQTSFLSHTSLGQIESVSEAQQEEELEEEEVSTSRDSTPKASAMRQPATPTVQLQEEVSNENILPQTVSDETRREISHLIKDAGFRSSIPSSIMRDMRPNVMEQPGDAAVFEKLMNDMKPRSAQPPSPQIGGFGSSSPIRKLPTSPNHFGSQRGPSQSPAPMQSSWVTVDEPMSSQPLPSLPKEPEQDSQDWVTDSEDQPSSPPVIKPVKREPIKAKPRKRVPIGNAQAMWEQLAGSRSNTHSPAESVKSSEPEPTKEDKDLYPKLLTQSSFSSQLAHYDQQAEIDIESKVTSVTTVKETDVMISMIPSTGHRLEQKVISRQVSTEAESVKAPRPRLPSKSPISARIEELLNSPTKRIPRTSYAPETTPSPEQAPPRKISPPVQKSFTPVPALVATIERTATPEKAIDRSLTPVAIQAAFPRRLPTPEKIQAPKNSPVLEKTPSVAQLQQAAPKKVSPVLEKASFIIHKSPTPEVPIPKKVVTKPPPVELDSDDDEFPSIEVMLSQKPPKVEKKASISVIKSNGQGAEKRKPFGLDGTSEEFGESGRSSQNQNRHSQPRASQGQGSENPSHKSRDFQSRQSQSRTIKTRDSQPPASQTNLVKTPVTFIDLSQSSDHED